MINFVWPPYFTETDKSNAERDIRAFMKGRGGEAFTWNVESAASSWKGAVKGIRSRDDVDVDALCALNGQYEVIEAFEERLLGLVERDNGF